MDCLLSIENLDVNFNTGDGVVRAVSGVDLAVEKGKIVGLVGETGCGKSVLGLSIMGLLPTNAEVRGTVTFKGKNLLNLPEGEIRKIRGKEIALIPQNPSTSLNPVLKIGVQIVEVIHLHQRLSRKKARQAAVELLRSLNFSDPDKRMEEYPHQFSGGMMQRILAGIGIAGEPHLLIADEPTKGLDALIREQVVDILRHMVLKTDAAMLLITHDLKVASCLCDKIAVMYAGEIIEIGPTKDILSFPQHPYTIGLISSLPSRGMVPIKGSSPSMIEQLDGCKFHLRCSQASKECSKTHPRLEPVEKGCKVRCLQSDQGCKSEKKLFHGNIQKKVV
ncbi:MAG: ABC transporter ATP-binding protein [Candidatus Contubernalis sp.]|nr:ABC transporter ATP-binding protein [Candidatus Contubernalis sp.]